MMGREICSFVGQSSSRTKSIFFSEFGKFAFEEMDEWMKRRPDSRVIFLFLFPLISFSYFINNIKYKRNCFFFLVFFFLLYRFLHFYSFTFSFDRFFPFCDYYAEQIVN